MFPALAALKLRLANRFERSKSNISGLPRVGGLASIPSRAADLAEVLGHILPQLDRLHLFLHGYREVPPEAVHPKIQVCLAPADTPYRASGKLYGLSREPGPCVYVCFDDDIRYLAGHVDRLVSALERYGAHTLVGLHGSTYRDQALSFLDRHRVYQFHRGYALSRVVDVLGTGTVAFVNEHLSVDPTAWLHGDMDDIMLAIEAEKRGMPRVCVARPKSSITPIAERQPDSLWSRTLEDSTRQTEQLAVLLELSRRHLHATG